MFQYIEEYAIYLESNGVELDEGSNVEQMWNNVAKTAIERKEAAWKEVLGVRDKVA